MPVAYCKTPVGTLRVSGTNAGISEVDFTDTTAVSESVHHSLKECVRQLDEFFHGDRTTFALTLSPSGTEFQRQVWDALRAIPYGKTRTYGEIANDIGKPGALRAVGTACGANPLCVVIPCHRVLAKNGIGGYSSGIERKKWLLTKENAQSAP